MFLLNSGRRIAYWLFCVFILCLYSYIVIFIIKELEKLNYAPENNTENENGDLECYELKNDGNARY